MPKRKRDLTREEIFKFREDFYDETYEDVDSDCEFGYDKESAEFLDACADGNAIYDSGFQQITNVWQSLSQNQMATVHLFRGKNQCLREALAANTEMEFFECVFPESLLAKIVEETNKYAAQLINKEGKSPEEQRSHRANWTDINGNELKRFFALTLLMGHIEKENLKDYWSTDKMLETPFFGKTMARDRYLAILKYLHFADNSNPPNRDEPQYDRLWKIRSVFDILNNRFKEVYDPTEEMAIDEVIVSYKGSEIFRDYVPKKGTHSGIYKLVDMKGYAYNMKEYMAKLKQSMPESRSAAHETVVQLTECIKGKGHKLFMDDSFSSPQLFVELHREFDINCCGTVKKNCMGYPKDIGPPKMSKWAQNARFVVGMTALCWRKEHHVFMLSNMYDPSCDAARDLDGKPEIITSYNRAMEYVDLSNRVINSYAFGRKTLKWAKKLFFHLMDIAVLNAYILFSLKNSTCSHRNFRMNLIQQLIEGTKESQRLEETQNLSNNLNAKSFSVNKNISFPNPEAHWPIQQKVQRRCALCSKLGMRKRTSVSCKVCDVGLCVNCFELYHRKK